MRGWGPKLLCFSALAATVCGGPMAPDGPTAAWTLRSRRLAVEPQVSATRPLAAATSGGVR